MFYWLIFGVLLANCFDRQSVLCRADDKLSTGTPEIVRAQANSERVDGTTHLIDPFSRKSMIEVAKKEILRKLGMSKRPPQMDNLRANIPKPVFDGDISSLFSAETESAKTTQIVIPAEDDDPKKCIGGDGCFTFHLTNRIFRQQVIEFASLRFFKDSRGSRAQKIGLAVTSPSKKFIALKRLPVARDWFGFRVDEQVEDWTKSKEGANEHYSFRISCVNCNPLNKFQVSTRSRYRPFLLVKTSEKKYKRTRKRRSFSVDCIPGYDKCCRQSLYVSFKEIGWHDWIIEPSGIEVNVCKGRCSGGAIDVAKSHGFVKKELMRNKKNGFLSICCVPTKFDMLLLLHFDEDGFIFTTPLGNMIVKECGCM